MTHAHNIGKKSLNDDDDNQRRRRTKKKSKAAAFKDIKMQQYKIVCVCFEMQFTK